jgi:hypothetical protein
MMIFSIYCIFVIIFMIASSAVLIHCKKDRLKDKFNIRDDEGDKFYSLGDFLISFTVSATLVIPIILLILISGFYIIMGITEILSSLFSVKIFRIK